jgi:hypothetical protein
MMRFPADLDATAAAKAKRDLDRRLRASSGWDKEGRDGPTASLPASAAAGDTVNARSSWHASKTCKFHNNHANR